MEQKTNERCRMTEKNVLKRVLPKAGCVSLLDSGQWGVAGMQRVVRGIAAARGFPVCLLLVFFNVCSLV